AAKPPTSVEPPRSSVPFHTMPPLASAERRGGVGATFVPAAGPIPFAHIGAFRWLLTSEAKPSSNGSNGSKPSASVAVAEPASIAPASIAPPPPAPVPVPVPAPAPAPVVAKAPIPAPAPRPVPAPAPFRGTDSRGTFEAPEEDEQP